MPPMFQNNWAPQVMPPTLLVLPNTFNNFNIDNMGPPLQQNPMNGPPQGQPFNQPPPMMNNTSIAMTNEMLEGTNFG